MLGLFAVLAAVSRHMIENGCGGSIVNIASMAGVSGAPNMPAYSASKAAVIGLTKAAAKDLAPAGIRVNAVSPAFIGPGRMWDTQVAQQASRQPVLRGRPRGRRGADDRHGAAPPLWLDGRGRAVVAFLLSEEASYVTGVNLEVSGGSA